MPISPQTKSASLRSLRGETVPLIALIVLLLLLLAGASVRLFYGAEAPIPAGELASGPRITVERATEGLPLAIVRVAV
jgi:hypothetical protein